MLIRRAFSLIGVVLLTAASLHAAASDVADAVMKGNKEALRSLLQRKADVNAPQVDGTTALHWAVLADDLETADLLIRAGAKVSAANREGAMPMQLATINGNAAMIDKMIKAGADANASLTKYGDTPLMMASRTGKTDAIQVLLDAGAKINTKETWGGTTALMWAVSERKVAATKMLIDRGADVNTRSYFVPSANGRGFEGSSPAAGRTSASGEENATGSLTPLMFATREGDLECARLLVAAGADVNALDGDGKDVLGLAVFNGSYDVASLRIDNHSKVNQADAQRFTPLFWAVDRRNMETAPNFPWVDAVKLMTRIMQEKGIKHTTSECTLRGFTCSIANVDPKTATPAQIALIRKIQIGYQVDGLTRGLGTKDPDKK